ncbi:hypothetical protein BDR03DRAFT_949740 [Suillus americanus]|nr:hypothetical protein BDR03DRAFT_949740 [Suillus americanus]
MQSFCFFRSALGNAGRTENAFDGTNLITNYVWNFWKSLIMSLGCSILTLLLQTNTWSSFHP